MNLDYIGVSQLLAGFLLMTQRYSKLGALANFPIIVNIFVITLSYDFAFTPIITGLMLLANLALIFWDWNELKVLFNLTPVIDKTKRLEKFKVWEITGLTLFIFTFLYRILVDKYRLEYWFITCFVIALAGLFVGLHLYRNKKNQIIKDKF